MKIKQNLKIFIYMFLALFLLVVAIISGWGNSPAFASTSDGYSDVLDDLNRDSNFNYEDFPPDTEDFSLQVKQIAETGQGELLIYVYQPACRNDLLASSIRIAREPDDKDKELDFNNYSLEYLNSRGVFFKYRVQGFKINSDKIRCYNIPSISRKWDNDIDGEPENAPGNHITQVTFEVGQTWYAQTVDGNVVYSMQETETIEITSKYISFIRYHAYQTPDWVQWVFGRNLGSDDFVEAWYVAFDTDKQIDLLLEAEVYYTTAFALKRPNGSNVPLDGSEGIKADPEVLEALRKEHDEVLKYDDKDKVELPNDIWGNTYTHTWSLIQSVETFKASEGLGDVEGLSDKKWVLRFYQCLFDFKEGTRFSVGWAYGDVVEEFTILRLKFLSKGRVYNLGAVDNFQAADSDKQPDKDYRPSGGCVGIDLTFVWIVLGIIAFIIILCLLLRILLPLLGTSKRNKTAVTVNLVNDPPKNKRKSNGRRRTKKPKSRKRSKK